MNNKRLTRCGLSTRIPLAPKVKPPKKSNTTTVDIPNELLKKARALGKEIKEQDNRGTASPYFYTLRQTKRIYGMDPSYSDDSEWLYHDDEHWPPSEEEEKEALASGDEEKWYTENRFEQVYYKDVECFDPNPFLSEKSIRQHYRLNKYHYSDDDTDFLHYAWRNPDMELIYKLLIELSKEDE